MVASIITNHSVPAGLDSTNLLRVEKVTGVDVFTLIRGARPATLGLFKSCPEILNSGTWCIQLIVVSSDILPSLSSSFTGWLS